VQLYIDITNKFHLVDKYRLDVSRNKTCADVNETSTMTPFPAVEPVEGMFS